MEDIPEETLRQCYWYAEAILKQLSKHIAPGGFVTIDYRHMLIRSDDWEIDIAFSK